MNWKWAFGITGGLFAAGIAVGYAAQKRGIPRDEVGRWALKEATRKALHAYDTVRELLPDQEPVPLSQALKETEEP